MNKVVVTGGAGFIGSNLVDALVETGEYEVHIIDNLSNGKRENINPKAIFHEVDIRDKSKLIPVFKDAHCLFHTAALPRVQYSILHPEETHDVNINGTFSVLTAAKEAGVKRIVYSASSSAYGDKDTFPLVEAMEPDPISPYALQKYVGEVMMKTWHKVYGIPTVSLRYFNVFGPRQSNEGAYALVIAIFLRQRAAGESMTITGDGGITRDFTHVRDVVKANILAMNSPNVGRGEVLNIGGGQEHSVMEIAKMIGGPHVFIPPRLEPLRTLADSSKARALLGWEPKEDFKMGIEELKKLANIR